MAVTHKLLVHEAVRWLLGTRRCYFASSEHVCLQLSEIPDAIGWSSEGSILVECKMSLGDFRNEKKHKRRTLSGRGLGQERWYYAPEGVIPKSELPEGWGLLERQEYSPESHICKRVVQPYVRESSVEMLIQERIMLISAARRACDALTLVKPFFISEVPIVNIQEGTNGEAD